MNKMMKMLKKCLNWYFNQYVEFYRPMIENNTPIII